MRPIYSSDHMNITAAKTSVIVPYFTRNSHFREFLPFGEINESKAVGIIFHEEQITVTATLTQQIFDGSYIVGVQATKAFLDYSQNNKEKTDLDVRKAVIEAYGNVLLAQESVAILEKNKETLSKNLFETKKIYENVDARKLLSHNRIDVVAKIIYCEYFLFLL